MQPVLTAFSSALLVCSWQALPHLTYTLQTSKDLLHWQSLHAVWENLEGRVDTHLPREERVFARLRYADDGDTNENGLPDNWELATFHVLDIDPAADPDGDGLTNATEWEQGSPPLDFYNGQAPRIYLTCGEAWWIPAGEASSQTLSLRLEDSEGRPLPDCPVDLAMESGLARLTAPGFSDGTVSMRVWTNAKGCIEASGLPVGCLFPVPGKANDRLLISAGAARASLELHSLVRPLQSLPGGLQWSGDTVDGFSVSWRGDPSMAHGVRLESAVDGTSWQTLAEIPVDQLPAPDPLSGRYILHLQGNL